MADLSISVVFVSKGICFGTNPAHRGISLCLRRIGFPQKFPYLCSWRRIEEGLLEKREELLSRSSEGLIAELLVFSYT